MPSKEDEYKIIDINPYNVHQRVAETFGKGRVLLRETLPM